MLNLDIDQVRTFVGGWRERFAETGAIVRPMARGMAASYLRGGRDVIMPRYLGNRAEIEAFEAVAHEHGAAFREIVLRARPATTVLASTEGEIDLTYQALLVALAS